MSGTGEPRKTTTAADGQYRLADLTPGVYRIQAELVGFRRSTVETVTVATGADVTKNFSLRIGFMSIVDSVFPTGARAGRCRRPMPSCIFVSSKREGPACSRHANAKSAPNMLRESFPSSRTLVRRWRPEGPSRSTRVRLASGSRTVGPIAVSCAGPAGDQFIGLFRRNEAGQLEELIGRHYTFRVVDKRVHLSPYFRDTETGLLQEDMTVDAFAAVIGQLLPR